MSEEHPQSHDPVDRLVRGYLENRAQASDADALLARVRMHPALSGPIPNEQVSALSTENAETLEDATIRAAERPLPPASRPWPARSWTTGWFVWPAVAAAAIVLAFVGGRQIGPQTAGAATMLRQVQAVHAGDVDRCYQVNFLPDPDFWDGKNKLHGPSNSLLWTRGDRFWADCQLGDVHLSIGRQADQTLWSSASRQKGRRFTNDPDHLPANMAQLCDIVSMSIPRLLESVLADFDFHSDHLMTHDGRARTLVWANPKPDRSHALVAHALLEIDDQTNVLTRLVLWTLHEGQPRGTQMFTLVASAPADDSRYELSSHLDADAVIETDTLRERGQRAAPRQNRPRPRPRNQASPGQQPADTNTP